MDQEGKRKLGSSEGIQEKDGPESSMRIVEEDFADVLGTETDQAGSCDCSGRLP